MVALVDKYSDKFISRKFLAWIVSTGLLVFNFLTPDIWMTITSVYIGSQSIVDLTEKIKNIQGK